MKITIPFDPWNDPRVLELTFPDSWNVSVCRMNGAEKSVLTGGEIKRSILNAIGTPNLSELAKGTEKVVIVADDMTRSTPVSKIMPFILEELEKARIKKGNITILLATGAHRPMNRNDCILKLGKNIVNTINIENHHPYENLTNLGVSSNGMPIDVNTTYYNADLRIAVGGVVSHQFAGFGGGAKMILPGVCGIRTLEATHSLVIKGIGAGIGRVTEFREIIEDIVGKIGLDFSINAVLNESSGIVGVFSGHFIDAHRKALEMAKQVYGTIPTNNNQACFLNAYPESNELHQAKKGLNFLLTAPNEFLEQDGTIILMTSSFEGRGYHSLVAQTGARLFSKVETQVIWRDVVRKRRVYFFSPNISKPDLYHYYPKSVKLYRDWSDLIIELEKIYGTSPKAAIIPTCIQLAEGY